MGYTDTTIDEEERRRRAEAIARKLVDQSAGTADRGDAASIAASYADDRALEALSRPSDELHEAPTGPRYVGSDREHGPTWEMPRGGAQPMRPEDAERVRRVDAQLQQPGGARAVERATIAEQRPEPDADDRGGAPDGDADDRAIEALARPAVTAASPAPMAQRAQGTGTDRGMTVADGPDLEPDADADDRALASLAGAPRDRASALGDPTGPPPLRDPGFAPAKPAAPPAREFAGGIPGDDALGRARTEDAVRRPLHALANALRAIGGRGGTAFRSHEDEVRQRQHQMLGEKRQALAQEQQQARQDRALQMQEQRADRSADLQGRALDARMARDQAQADLARRTADRQDAIADATIARTGEQTETARASRETAEARRTPGSPEAMRAAERLSTLLDAALPEGPARDRAREALGIGDDLGQRMSAEDIAGLERDLDAYMRLSQSRRSGGGGGGARSGAGTPRAQWGTAEDPLVEAAVEMGVDRRVAVAAASQESSRRQLERTLSGAGVSQTRADTVAEESARIPGWRRSEDAPRLTPRQAEGVRRVAVADGEFRRAVARIESIAGQLTATERAAGMAGLGSQRYREVEHALEVIRTQLRAINSAGNSLGAQHAAEVSIPGLDRIASIDALLNNVRAASAVKHDYVESLLESNGYEPDTGGGEGGGRSGGGEREAVPAPSGARVAIVLPDGRRATVPESQLEAALARGARRAE